MAGTVAQTGRVVIHGQKELERAFLQLRRETLAEIRPVLRELGKIVADDAERRAGSEISNIGPRWQRMRVGVTVKAVYVVPRQRGIKQSGDPRKRPNLSPLMMNRAMQPALDAHQAEVFERFEALVDETAAANGFF
jgi:hypothetical protein